MSKITRIDLKDAPQSLKLNYSVVAFLLVAANLRPALTSVGPLLETVRSSLDLTGTEAGLLTALPLLVFAGSSPLVRASNVFGIERTFTGCLLLIAAGIALRSAGSITALFSGTIVLGVGIGVANVVMPSVIKRDFPQHVAGMTTAYIMVMTFAGALATGVAVPLSIDLPGGWQSSLAIWAAFTALTLLCWLPEAQKADASVTIERLDDRAAKPIWRSVLAWQITIFMGLQFFIYYVMIGWMPLFLVSHGQSAAAAGWLMTLYQTVAFGVGFVVPGLLRRESHQRLVAVLPSIATALATLGLLAVPHLAIVWLMVLGISFGMLSFWPLRSSGCARAIIDAPHLFRRCHRQWPT